MGRIVISDNVSFDGVVQDPAGDEGFTRGGRVGRITDRPEVGKRAPDEALDADGFGVSAADALEAFHHPSPNASASRDRENSRVAAGAIEAT